MYVCVCKAVSDKRIHQLVEEGLRTVREVSHATGLGTCCGACVPQAREIVSGAREQRPIRLADLTPMQMTPIAA